MNPHTNDLEQITARDEQISPRESQHTVPQSVLESVVRELPETKHYHATPSWSRYVPSVALLILAAGLAFYSQTQKPFEIKPILGQEQTPAQRYERAHAFYTKTTETAEHSDKLLLLCNAWATLTQNAKYPQCNNLAEDPDSIALAKQISARIEEIKTKIPMGDWMTYIDSGKPNFPQGTNPTTPTGPNIAAIEASLNNSSTAYAKGKGEFYTNDNEEMIELALKNATDAWEKIHNKRYPVKRKINSPEIQSLSNRAAAMIEKCRKDLQDRTFNIYIDSGTYDLMIVDTPMQHTPDHPGAQELYNQAKTKYKNAKGFFNDNEEEIKSARELATKAWLALNAHDHPETLDHTETKNQTLNMRIHELIKECDSDIN